MKKTYTGLHVHSVFSVLDGFGKIDEIVDKCKEFNMKGVCVTDHGNMMSAYELYKSCKKKGIKPIFANETYIAPDSALVKEKIEGYKAAYHLILIAMNDIGYKNLMKLTSWSWINGKYYRPRVDFARLSEYSEGIICSSACLGGYPSQMFLEGKLEEAEDVILKFKRIFGDRYYLELTHTGQKINGEYTQTLANNFLVSMADKHDIELIATSDAHYVNIGDSPFHATLVDINTGGIYRKKNKDSENSTDESGDGLWYEKEQYYIKSYDDIVADYIRYHGEDFLPIIEKALENTNKIAERCNVNFVEGMKIIPQVVENPDKMLAIESKTFLLSFLEKKGAVDLSADTDSLTGLPIFSIKNNELFNTYWERLDVELEIIKKMEFSDYFFVVAEYVQWAKDHGIMVGGGRGSAAGSLVAYCMRITGIDPIEYNLLFGRFLNRGRAKRPVINFPEYTYENFLEKKRE